MSEYQYYQFQSIDQPLTDRQMKDLRAISTRAEITPHSFTNEYHWGDLKACPLGLVKRYFDAHLYVANWGTHTLMLKLPRNLIDEDAAREYCTDETLALNVHRDRIILTFTSNNEDGEDWESGESWLASLLPLRNDLMQGDLRSLYLGWLAGAWEEGDNTEPPLPPGMSRLNGPLKALAGFLRIDLDLLDVAGQGNDASLPDGPTPDDVATWIRRLPVLEKNECLARLLSMEHVPLSALSELRQRFQKEWNEKSRSGFTPAVALQRTVARLFEQRDVIVEERCRREAERKARERARQEKKKAVERRRYLEQIAANEDGIWHEVDSLLNTTIQKNYDRAVRLLQDLHDLAANVSATEQWQKRVVEYRDRNSRKSSLIKRFDKAGFP